MSDSVRTHRWQPTRLPHPWDSPGKNTGVGCHCLLQCMKVKSESKADQSCLTLSDLMDCSPPGSSIHGIFQARVLEWGAIAFSGLFLVGEKKNAPSFFLLHSSCTDFLSVPEMFYFSIYMALYQHLPVFLPRLLFCFMALITWHCILCLCIIDVFTLADHQNYLRCIKNHELPHIPELPETFYIYESSGWGRRSHFGHW